MEELWEMVVQRLSGSLSETAIRTWFSDCTLLAFDTNKITLRAGSDFKKAVIGIRFACLSFCM